MCGNWPRRAWTASNCISSCRENGSRQWRGLRTRPGLPVMMHCSPHGVLAAAEAGIDEFFHLDGLLTDIWPDCPVYGWLERWGHEDFPGTWARQQHVADVIARPGLIATPR